MLMDCILGVRERSQGLQVFALSNCKDENCYQLRSGWLWGERAWQGEERKDRQFSSGHVRFV